MAHSRVLWVCCALLCTATAAAEDVPPAAADGAAAQCSAEGVTEPQPAEGADTVDTAGGCGCSSASRKAAVKPTQGSTAREAAGTDITEGSGQADTSTDLADSADSTVGFRNISDAACSAEPHYEGYRVGCIHQYSDDVTGSTDCGMALIPGGNFTMGQEFVGDAARRVGMRNNAGLDVRYRHNTIHGVNKMDAEHPTHRESVGAFYMDRCEVTNAQFREFSESTKYVTDAELFGWSFVLEPFLPPKLLEGDPALVPQAPWWRQIEGASWRHPEGPGSTLDRLPRWHGKPTEGVPDQPEGSRWAHPASHISWRDAYNFCRWRGKRLPFEREWEYAVRGGKHQELFPWGERLYADAVHRMNVWQGDLTEFVNTAEDGARGTAQTASYPPNAYGLYDMTGNIWEWVQDDFDKGEKQTVQDRSETQGHSTASPRVSHKTKRGGSHMCHASTCNRYRNAGRTGIESDSSAGNLGFRCAKDL